MDTIDVQNIDSIAPYSGPHAIPGIRFRPAREALGVSAWGMNVIDFDPGTTGYPRHDHVADGQEEVYVVLRGSLVLHVDDARTVLAAGDMVRLGPDATRSFTTEDEPATILVIGNTPGAAYVPPSWG